MAAMKNVRRSGFSLPEAMLAMLLVLSILGMVAVLMREYTQVSRYSDAKNQTLDGVQFALAEMSHEVESAVVLIAPSGSVSYDVLDFKRMDPAIERYWLDPPERGSRRPGRRAGLRRSVGLPQPGRDDAGHLP